jgi:hypothetical protein
MEIGKDRHRYCPNACDGKIGNAPIGHVDAQNGNTVAFSYSHAAKQYGSMSYFLFHFRIRYRFAVYKGNRAAVSISSAAIVEKFL